MQVNNKKKIQWYIFKELWKSQFSSYCVSKSGQLFIQVQLFFMLTKYPVLYRTGTLKYSAGNATDKKSLANCL